MTQNFNNVIFDVGANNGLDGLILAILNPKMFDLSFSHDEYRDLCDSDFHDLYLLKN